MGALTKQTQNFFYTLCEKEGHKLSMERSVEDCAASVNSVILDAALLAIPIRGGNGRLKIVPWWTEACTKAINCDNAFRKGNNWGTCGKC